MKIIFVLTFFVCSLMSMTVQAYYSNVVQDHFTPRENSFYQRVIKRFYVETENGFDFSIDKVSSLLEEVKKKHEDVLPSIYMSTKLDFINNHNYSNKKATKKANKRIGKDARVNFPFIFLEKELELILQNAHLMDETELKSRAFTLSLVYESVEFPFQNHIYESTVRSVKNLIKPYYTIQKHEVASTQAKNLFAEKFLTVEDISKLLRAGDDLSLIDPPNSAFWKNTDIENFNPVSEVHLGEEIFPPKSQVYVYDRMGTGNIKIKADYFPSDVANVCDTEADNKNMTFRLGQETNNHLIATNLARALGFPYIPHAKRKKVIMYLCDTKLDEFLSPWNRFHQNQGSFFTYGRYLKEQHAVELFDLALEAYPGDDDGRYKKVGSYRTQALGLIDRREVRAQMVFNALIALVDAKEHNLRLDFYRKEQGEWSPLFFTNDLGRSLGFYLIRSHGSVNQFFNSFTTQDTDEVRIWWDHQGYDSKLFSKVTYSDARWIARRLARLSDQQINEIVEQTHHVPAVKALYKNKLKSRINKLIKDLGLEGEVYTDYEVKTELELSHEYPQFISKAGYIKSEAELIEGTNTRPLGFNKTFSEILGLAITDQIFSSISDSLAELASKSEEISESGTEVFGTTFDTVMGVRLATKREISLNLEKSKHENRLQIKDTLSVSIPIGLLDREATDSIFDLNLPLGGYYTYEFDYYFSVNSLAEALKVDFFQRFIPWRAEILKSRLKVGEGLHVKHYYGLTIGGFGAALSDKVGFSISPVQYDKTKMKSMYIYKPTDELVEVALFKNDKSALSSNLSFDLGLSIGARWKREKNKGHYSLFRFFSSDESIAETKAMNDLIIKTINDPTSTQGKTYVISPDSLKREVEGCFLIWCSFSSQTEKYYVIEHGDSFGTENTKVSHLEDRRIIVSESSKSSDRSFSPSWEEGIGVEELLRGPDTGLDITKEAKSQRIKIEAVWDHQQSVLGDFNVQIMSTRIDNLLFQSEVTEYEESINKTVSCQSADTEYFEIPKRDEIKYYSPMATTIFFQIDQKGLNELLSKLASERRLCRNRCQERLRRLSKLKTRTRPQVERFVKEVRNLFNTILGKDYSKIGCVRELIDEDHYWLVTKAENILRSHMPVAGIENFYFSKEIGKYQGPGPLQELIFKRYYAPVIDKASQSYDNEALKELFR